MGEMKMGVKTRPRVGTLRPPRWRSAVRISRLVLIVVLLASGSALAGQVEFSSDVYDVAEMIRCPVCQAESVADSNSEISQTMRQQIAEQLAAGKSKADILNYFEQRYGTWILMEPPMRGMYLLIWALPVVGVIGGVTALAVLFRRWNRQAERPVMASAEDQERVRQQLRELEGEQ